MNKKEREHEVVGGSDQKEKEENGGKSRKRAKKFFQDTGNADSTPIADSAYVKPVPFIPSPSSHILPSLDSQYGKCLPHLIS